MIFQGCATYLIGIHFKFADDLDSDFFIGLGVSGPIDVAKGTVAHLLDENIAFQARVLGQLARLFSFFCHDGMYFGVSANFLILARSMGRSTRRLSSDVSLVDRGDRMVPYGSMCMRLNVAVLFGHVGFADAIVISLGMDGR